MCHRVKHPFLSETGLMKTMVTFKIFHFACDAYNLLTLVRKYLEYGKSYYLRGESFMGHH